MTKLFTFKGKVKNLIEAIEAEIEKDELINEKIQMYYYEECLQD